MLLIMPVLTLLTFNPSSSVYPGLQKVQEAHAAAKERRKWGRKIKPMTCKNFSKERRKHLLKVKFII